MRILLTTGMAVLLSLSACQAERSDLDHFISNLKNQRPPLSRTDEMRSEADHAESAIALSRDPFTPTGSGQAMPETSLLKPDEKRPREPLENYPLEALRWVGTIGHRGVSWALIQVDGGAVYRARPGSYLGQNNGKIISLENDRLGILELESLGDGAWREHLTQIHLAHANSKESTAHD